MESLPLGAWPAGALAAPAIFFILAFGVILLGRVTALIRGRRFTRVQ